MSKKTFHYDANYICYIESGESAAVFITRDIVKEIDTNNKWIDVIDFIANNEHGQFDFKYIIVELFDRKIKPKYPEKSSFDEYAYKSYCKYITWLTATEDIINQRSKKLSGPKYLVLCKLKNRNKGRWITEEVLWNATFNRYVKPEWKTPSCVIRKRKRYIPPTKDDWYYEINAVKKLTDKDYKNIEKRKEFLTYKIDTEKELCIKDFFE